MEGRAFGFCPPIPLTSPPAQKAWPAPVTKTARARESSFSEPMVRRSAGLNVSESALRTSGRFSVKIATPSSMRASSSSVPVSRMIASAPFSSSIRCHAPRFNLRPRFRLFRSAHDCLPALALILSFSIGEIEPRGNDPFDQHDAFEPIFYPTRALTTANDRFGWLLKRERQAWQSLFPPNRENGCRSW